jgi:hypothetical protein
MAKAANRHANVYPTRAASMFRRFRDPTKMATANSPDQNRPHPAARYCSRVMPSLHSRLRRGAAERR